jgi:hypothetical protein
VVRIMNHVRSFRKEYYRQDSEDGPTYEPEIELRWPEDIDALTSAALPLEPAGSDLWPLASHETVADISNDDPIPLTCSDEFATIRAYSPDLPEHMILTTPRMACWLSHINVMRLIANEREGIAVVLEDDIDMELDIRERLGSIWARLPVEWDIVFLGAILRRLLLVN